MEILAHRTAMDNAPPNSLEGFCFCGEKGIKIIECDLSFSYDGQPVIWNDHDNHLLQRPIRSIGEHTLYELQKRERKDSDEFLLGIGDIWNFLQDHPKCRVLFDVKYYSRDLWGIVKRIPTHLVRLTLQEVIEPAITLKLINQIGFVTFEGGVRLLKTVKDVLPEIHTNLMVVWPWARISGHLNYLDGITIGWDGWNHWQKIFARSAERLILTARESGLKVWGGHANSLENRQWLVDSGFNGMWTNDIVTAKKYLEELDLRLLV